MRRCARAMFTFTLLLAAVARATTDSAVAAFEPLARAEFQPSAGERLPIAIRLNRSGTVTLAIYSGDNDLMRTLVKGRTLGAGRHEFVWDGRDEQGLIVPNEAYQPVLTCVCGGDAPLVLDARGQTGGMVIEKIRPELSADGAIHFDLPTPARTLVRVGIKGGAMMRALDAWSPRSAGRVRLTWDGLDQSGVARLLGEPGLTVLVTAFSLPDHAIITSGSVPYNYFEYRSKRKWSVPAADAKHGALERDGKRLSRQASLPRSLLADPRVSLTIVENVPKTPSGLWKVKGPVTLKVDMPAEDKWLVQQSLYEVGFFLDYQFVSEEETGYTPLSWRWDPVGVAPGEHTMTVNISGFWGQVGVASIRMMIEK
jgi:hypothetical protein